MELVKAVACQARVSFCGGKSLKGFGGLGVFLSHGHWLGLRRALNILLHEAGDDFGQIGVANFF